MRNWINTIHGKQFNPFDPEEKAIHLEDIVVSLSRLCRFLGHTNRFYSVLSHSLLVHHIVKDLHPEDKELQLAALMHDMSEAFLADIPTPVKRSSSLTGYLELEKNLESRLFDFFEVDFNKLPEVKEADLLALHVEANVLLVRVNSEWNLIPRENIKESYFDFLGMLNALERDQNTLIQLEHSQVWGSTIINLFLNTWKAAYV